MKHGLGLALCFVVSMMLPTKGESFSFDEVGILVNETTGAISVTYSARIVVATDGTRYCGIPSDLFLAAAPTREGKVGDGIRPPSMRRAGAIIRRPLSSSRCLSPLGDAPTSGAAGQR